MAPFFVVCWFVLFLIVSVVCFSFLQPQDYRTGVVVVAAVFAIFRWSLTFFPCSLTTRLDIILF